jgi:hypothetical protein
VSELICQRCDGPNIWSWSVDSDRFNLSMEALGLDAGAVVCPVCFVEGHEKATGLRTTWRMEVSQSSGFHHVRP